MGTIYLDENLPYRIAEGLNILEQGAEEPFKVFSIKTAFGPGVPDEVWIPKVGAEGGIVVTQDIRIFKNTAQRALFVQYGVGLVFLYPPGKKARYSYWQIVEQLVKHWQQIRQKYPEERPFAVKITATGNQLARM